MPWKSTLPADDLDAWRCDAEHRAPDHALASAGLADQRMHFTGCDAQADAAQDQSLRAATLRAQCEVQVVNLQDAHRLATSGSSDSRKPSPSALHASTVIAIAVIGSPSSHGVWLT